MKAGQQDGRKLIHVELYWKGNWYITGILVFVFPIACSPVELLYHTYFWWLPCCRFAYGWPMCSACLVKLHRIIVHLWGLINHIHCSWSRQFLEIYSWNLLYILDIKWPNQLDSSLFFYADRAIIICSVHSPFEVCLDLLRFMV